MKVNEIMTPNPACCVPETSLRDVAKLMLEYDCGEIPVIDRQTNKAMGVVTDRDIVCRIIAQGKNPLEMNATDCMSSPCISISQDASLEACRDLMQQYKLRRIVATERDGQISGIVAQADIAISAPTGETGEIVKEVSQPRAA